ncbi:MAG: hypothetical protein C0399_01550 [Syntrophus sp. (in: bacteria)]|nr:hypothetical protein [Syntrophus sp. (in: bacteria)]
MENKRQITEKIIKELGIGASIQNLIIEDAGSPWQEKIIIKGERGHLDIKTIIWDDELFLFGRTYRLFLYVADVLNPQFLFDPTMMPDESREPLFRGRHNQLWCIYVDSRIEKMGIDNFYDKTLRKNLFIDSEKGLAWKEADDIFEMLWKKASFSYTEIVDYSCNFGKLLKRKKDSGEAVPREIEINAYLRGPSIQKQLEKIPSEILRNKIQELLSFVAKNHKGIRIEPSYYGILFLYRQQLLVELVPLKNNTLVFTILDMPSSMYRTYTINESSDTDTVRNIIRVLVSTFDV